jgi:predicted nucleic acid-binding protein
MTRLVVDANVLTSAILGQGTRIERLHARDVELLVPEPQLDEVLRVVTRLGIDPDQAGALLTGILASVNPLEEIALTAAEPAARDRLHDRAQPDWPVLAAALTFDANVWSDDRDFFGVGVPVWSTRNIDRTYLGTGKDHG